MLRIKFQRTSANVCKYAAEHGILKHFITTSTTRKHYHSIHYLPHTPSLSPSLPISLYMWIRNFYSRLLLICTCFTAEIAFLCRPSFLLHQSHFRSHTPQLLTANDSKSDEETSNEPHNYLAWFKASQTEWHLLGMKNNLNLY